MSGMEVLTEGCVDWQADLTDVDFGSVVTHCV